MKKIGIIGAGRLGICLALNLERVGYTIVAIDSSEKRVQQINTKELKVEEPNVENYLRESTNLSASTDVKDLLTSEIDFIFVCVPTPSLESGKYDHSSILSCVEELLKHGDPKSTIDLVINSTTMPGFCDQLQTQLKDTNYIVSYNPEFIAQGSIIRDQQFPDQVLIGEVNPTSGKRISEVYKKMCPDSPEVHHMSRTSAEITKLGINCFLTTKIAFANSIGDLSQKMGAEYDKVLASIGSDSRIGNTYLTYGFGFGGPCLPRDNRALAKAGEEHNIELHISKATNKANASHLDFQFAEYANHAEPIVFDQVTYKAGTDIIEESQYLALAVRLMQSGKKVLIKASDGVIDQVKEVYGDSFTYERNLR